MTRSLSLLLSLLTGSLAAAVVVATSRNTPRVVAAAPRPPVMSAGMPTPAQNTTAPAGVVPKPSRDLPPLSVAGEQKVANGKILEVSESGAGGLAQATPVAYLQERFDGRLFVTADYLDGARAYVTKKPLGDAYRIASLASRNDIASRGRAAGLLPAAQRLRREGYAEPEAPRPHADARFYAAIEDGDRRNRELLDELERLIARDERPALNAYERRVHLPGATTSGGDEWAFPNF